MDPQDVSNAGVPRWTANRRRCIEARSSDNVGPLKRKSIESVIRAFDESRTVASRKRHQSKKKLEPNSVLSWAVVNLDLTVVFVLTQSALSQRKGGHS
jgi:hypothetical protein